MSNAPPPTQQPGPEQPILVLVRDLIFSGRITATARAVGVPLILLRDPAELADANGRRLIVDLNQPSALEAAAAWKRSSAGDVVGFVSHVDTETISRARAAGIDRVLARGQFVQVLEELLRQSRE